MKQNWSKFFTQYTFLLVIGSLIIGGTLLYIGNKDELTTNTNNLQEPKTITIKKTYKDISVNEYHDKEYIIEDAPLYSSTANSQNKSDQQIPQTKKSETIQPTKSLTVKTAKKTTNTKTKKKRGLNARNPYAIEYANAIKEYTALAKKFEELKAEKKVATGNELYNISNKLRQMKPDQINSETKLKNSQKKYREWEKSN